MGCIPLVPPAVGLAMSAQRRLWPLGPQAGQGSGQALGEGVLGVSRERAMLGSQIHRRASLLSGCVISAFPQVLQSLGLPLWGDGGHQVLGCGRTSPA